MTYKNGMISTGMLLLSATGRALAPAPRVDCTTDRKCTATIRRIEVWLIDEAQKEYDHKVRFECANVWMRDQLAEMKPGKLSQSDLDTLNDIVFGQESGPTEKNWILETA